MMLEELSKNEFKLFEQFKMFIESSINPWDNASSLHLALTEAGVEYAFIGGIALRPYNYARMTEDIDILVSKSTFNNLQKLLGLGYSLRPGSNKNMNMHLMTKNLPINVLVEGQQENGFTIPNPKSYRSKINGVWYVSLSGLIHLKLIASREQDLSDIKILIKENELTKDFYMELPKETQTKFLKLFTTL